MKTVRISLSRDSFCDGGCSMRITEDVRRYAQEQGIAEEVAIEERIETEGN
jgi:hypothetical protein